MTTNREPPEPIRKPMNIDAFMGIWIRFQDPQTGDHCHHPDGEECGALIVRRGVLAYLASQSHLMCYDVLPMVRADNPHLRDVTERMVGAEYVWVVCPVEALSVGNAFLEHMIQEHPEDLGISDPTADVVLCEMLLVNSVAGKVDPDDPSAEYRELHEWMTSLDDYTYNAVGEAFDRVVEDYGLSWMSRNHPDKALAYTRRRCGSGGHQMVLMSEVNKGVDETIAEFRVDLDKAFDTWRGGDT